MYLTSLLGIICFALVSRASPVHDDSGASSYLQKFGYLETQPGAMVEHSKLSSAIRDFQRFGGLAETGVLDSQTIALMNTPRCGLKDRIGHSGRKKRYAVHGSKWPKRELTYRITKYPARIRKWQSVQHEIARSFKLWSDVTPLTFKEAKTGNADIDIRFVVGNHGDNSAFDGRGGTLAHAYFPQYGGAAHFDDEEIWAINEKSDSNLHEIAAHEFGHSLGLHHTNVPNGLMYPYYRGYRPGLKLDPDDINGIQYLYGQPSNTPPNLCQDASIDAITRTQDGSTYVFKGNFYWQVLSNGLAPGYPRRISDDWGGLEGNLDASVAWPDGKTYFFKGGRYWRTTNRYMDSGYPKYLTTGFVGIPDLLDAALLWRGNGKLYFFKGNEYWRYDSSSYSPVSGEYPLYIGGWNGLPTDGIDAAFVWDNNASYFFKGDQYYKYNDATSEVDPGYPRSTATMWFGC